MAIFRDFYFNADLILTQKLGPVVRSIRSDCVHHAVPFNDQWTRRSPDCAEALVRSSNQRELKYGVARRIEISAGRFYSLMDPRASGDIMPGAEKNGQEFLIASS